MPQKYLEFWGTRMMVSPKFFGNTLLWSQSQKLYGKKSPKCLPSRQKNQFCAKEAVSKTQLLSTLPRNRGCRRQPQQLQEHLEHLEHSLVPEPVGRARLEEGAGSEGGSSCQSCSRDSLQVFYSLSLFSSETRPGIFSSTPNPCATSPCNVDTDLKIFKLKNNIIMLLSCSLWLYSKGFRGNF